MVSAIKDPRTNKALRRNGKAFCDALGIDCCCGGGEPGCISTQLCQQTCPRTLIATIGSFQWSSEDSACGYPPPPYCVTEPISLTLVKGNLGCAYFTGGGSQIIQSNNCPGHCELYANIDLVCGACPFQNPQDFRWIIMLSIQGPTEGNVCLLMGGSAAAQSCPTLGQYVPLNALWQSCNPGWSYCPPPGQFFPTVSVAA